jgi:hypothetical protein
VPNVWYADCYGAWEPEAGISPRGRWGAEKNGPCVGGLCAMWRLVRERAFTPVVGGTGRGVARSRALPGYCSPAECWCMDALDCGHGRSDCVCVDSHTVT